MMFIEAICQFNQQEDFEASMKGIVCDTNPAVRDEAPQAYKDLGKAAWLQMIIPSSMKSMRVMWLQMLLVSRF